MHSFILFNLATGKAAAKQFLWSLVVSLNPERGKEIYLWFLGIRQTKMPTHGERHVIELNLNFCILAIELNSRSVFYFCMSATKCGKFKDTHSFHLVCQRMACELNPKADAPHSRIRKKGRKKKQNISNWKLRSHGCGSEIGDSGILGLRLKVSIEFVRGLQTKEDFPCTNQTDCEGKGVQWSKGCRSVDEGKKNNSMNKLTRWAADWIWLLKDSDICPMPDEYSMTN